MLNALGLGNNSTPLVPLRSNVLVPYEQRKPYIRKTYEVDELRQASLRDRQHKPKPKQKDKSDSKSKTAGLHANAKAARSSRAAKRAAISAMAPVARGAGAASSQLVVRKQPNCKAGTLDRPAGQRGGWNASASYEGTAVVRGRGITKRVIAIRKRDENGRLYGYVGRTQVSWNPEFTSFPTVLCAGITVLEYRVGGRLDDSM